MDRDIIGTCFTEGGNGSVDGRVRLPSRQGEARRGHHRSIRRGGGKEKLILIGTSSVTQPSDTVAVSTHVEHAKAGRGSTVRARTGPRRAVKHMHACAARTLFIFLLSLQSQT